MAKRYTQLTIKERYYLELLIQDECSNKEIAKRLGRDKSPSPLTITALE